MIKKSILIIGLIYSSTAFAQQGSASPYSFFGIGDVRYKGTVEMQSMGGLGVEKDSIHINLDNPASFANLKWTTLTLGGSYNITNLKTTSETANTRRTRLDYFAFGLPILKNIGIGIGLIPYSSVGYRTTYLSLDDTKNNSRFEGKGGLNKVFFGLGYKVNPKWNVGAAIQYNFGKITTDNLEYISGIPVGTQEMNTVEMSGFSFDIGAMYQTKITTKLNFYTSLNGAIESRLKAATTATLATVKYDSNFNLTVVDKATDVLTITHFRLPSTVTFGVGIGQSKKWLLGTQVKLGASSNFNNTYNTLSNVYYNEYQKYSLGGYFISNHNSFSSYRKRLVYRGGIKYEKIGLVINSEPIKDIGLMLGIGLPITGSFSNVNFGLEWGRKGTTSSGLVQENYLNFSLSFSLNDRWFEKRKYN